MEWIIILAIVAFIVWRMMPSKGVSSISMGDLKSKLSDKNAQFVDVRTPGEYKGRHIKEFKNMPLDQLPSKLGQLDKEKETYVICQSGMRSSRAASILKKAGFTNVVNVRGGMSQW
ncbi:rhodanese-like domain-containing protein [Paenisporosarcina cavernae]|uniref:Rhodanese-like domain-containing protein n=1 Tax=Paenisporosarcina cavernae TaxID=2320858 RepID=A0A385YTI4_9BACL|nr:rhodanese-like domain-containing protein [Paenisporosarcina cavernae]AYC28988.1 rhodanese-like domain-containing protein [Paenisporosarcina cavernae]